MNDVIWSLPPDAVAECQRISDRLRGAQDRAEVNLIADDERQAVKKMASVEASKPLALNISNLKNYMLKRLKN